MDAFVSVGEAVAGAASKQEQLAAMVERLPVPGPDDTTSPSGHNSRLLMKHRRFVCHWNIIQH